MSLNKKNIKKIKDIGKKFVIAGSLIGMLVTPIFKTSAKAYEAPQDDCYYELSDDKQTISIFNAKNLSALNNIGEIDEVCIYNTNISSPINLKNVATNKLTLENCNFSSKSITLPDTMTILELDNTTLGNYSCITNNNNIMQLNIKNCNLKDLKIIPKNIYEFGIYQTKIDSLKGIDECKNLTFFEAYDSNFTSIDELKNLNNLNTLVLGGTYVEDISAIKNLKLSYLDVSNSTKIKSLDPILNINTLQTCYAYNCEMAYSNNVVNFIQKNNITSNISKEGLEYKNQVKQIANNIIKPNMTNEEKIYTIVKYVVDNVEYDKKYEESEDYGLELNRNGLKYALKGKGCCKNYTMLTTALLEEAKVNCYDVRSEDHIWNLVKLDNEYYWIDTTYIDEYDKNNIKNSDYYMEQSEFFEFTHPDVIRPNDAYNIIKQNNASKNEKITNNEIVEVTNVTEETKENIKTNISKGNISEENITTLKENEEKTKEAVNSALKSKKLSIGALVGILAAFGLAVPVSKKVINNKRKFEDDYNNEKIK